MFEQAYEKEENEDQEDSGQYVQRKRKVKKSLRAEKPKGSSIQFDSYIKTQVFMKVYESQLQKIKSEFNIEIVENGTEIIIVT